MHLCTCVSEERGGGESAGSEAPSLLSCTLRYVRLADLDKGKVQTQKRHLCCHEDGGDGESVGSEALSLLS